MAKITKQVSFHGLRDYLGPDDTHVAKNGFAAGGEASVGNKGGTIVFPSTKTAAIVDDFLGDVVADQWNAVEGDTGSSGGIVQAAGGMYRITTSATAAGAPSAYAGINGGLYGQWKANQGNLHLLARVKATVLTGGAQLFAGFTDTGAGEMPFYDTGGGIISTATNGIGWVYGHGASTATVWTGVGVNADANATPVAGDAPTANVYDVLEIWGNEAGDSFDFYQNGIRKGSMSSPVLPTRALIPAFMAFARDTGGFRFDVDLVNISANRDTGE